MDRDYKAETARNRELNGFIAFKLPRAESELFRQNLRAEGKTISEFLREQITLYNRDCVEKEQPSMASDKIPRAKTTQNSDRG
ncbi:MAG: hypothetical protein FWF98_03100 [Dehalococcoidia bacterium]|nr:hypothetical protein [Dehalococcoidia bacterium]